MKHVGKTLIALLVLIAFYSSYSFFQVRKELFNVYNVPDQYAYSAKNADLVIVDFNKYSCEVCQTLHPILMEAIKRDGKIRYIPRSVTHGFIWNETLASAVYAAAEQGKFIEMHNTIYENWPIEDHKFLFLYAESIGLDAEKLSRDMSDPKIIARIHEDQKFFKGWNLRQTPAILMGKKAIYRPDKKTPTVEDILDKFAKARSSK